MNLRYGDEIHVDLNYTRMKIRSTNPFRPFQKEGSSHGSHIPTLEKVYLYPRFLFERPLYFGGKCQLAP